MNRELDAGPESSDETDAETPPRESFAALSEGDDPGIVREFIWFLRYNKKWWMTPIIVIMLLLVALAFFTASPAAPFIYTLF
jgi:hypothetical protein